MKLNPVRGPAELFESARGLPPGDQRDRFLETACAGDPLLRARVDALLRAAEPADRFFAETSVAVTRAIGELHAARGSAGVTDALAGCLPGEEPIGSRIGRYKLLQKIGEGGCGVVYEAEQEEPVRRRVALKIIKVGMETRSVIARFEAERQALAMMDHPNIAHVFDAGATRRGPPYFVMELVRGIKITDYCDQNRLGLRERLDLFVQICHAIQHAHQKGIVHGDVKPSNLMVTLHDGVPLPKVIDFGIAKATEARLIDNAFATVVGQVLIGTPAYMSPEQVECNRLDIDTRSDIYSLGVLLYELLTGRTPFSSAELGPGIEELRRTLQEKEPPRPSQRLKLLSPAELTAVAQARSIEPKRLAALYRGDLDWVVMKALEKDRRRRYETANGLAVDIQRHLSNEPVVARSPSRLYRFQKLVRRNRGVFVAVGAVAVTLIAGMATSTWLFLGEREARQRAVAAEQQEAKLRRDAEVRQKIAQAALFVSQQRFKEADALLGGVRVLAPTVEGAAVFRALGEWHAMEGRWSEAASRFGVLLEIDQLDGWDVSTLDHLRQGAALLETGDRPGFDRFRSEALWRYGSGFIPAEDRIVKICLLASADDRQLEMLKPFAADTATALAAAQASGDGFTVAWRAMSLALWEYRRGDLAAALRWGERALSGRENNGPRNAAVHVILALTHRARGEATAATAHLEEARRLVANWAKGAPSLGNPVQGFWFDWEFARLLLREAERDGDASPARAASVPSASP